VGPIEKNPVVVVCENPLVENYLRFVLERNGCRVILCDPRRAVEMVQARQKVDLLITNSPADFLAIAAELPLLYLSAAPDPEIASHFSKLRVLEKPFRAEELLRAVKDLTSLS
jgi:hypothetical protein